MFSKRQLLGLGLILGGLAQFTALSGCGILPAAKDPKKILEVANEMGCLNTFGESVDRYLKGAMSADEWSGTWNCTLNSIRTFKNVVTGSVSDGYTQKDIRLFVKKFLITNREISPELVSSAFDLKASLLGGSHEVISTAELEMIYQLLSVVGRRSLEWLPWVAARAHHPTVSDLVNYSSIAIESGREVGEFLTQIRVGGPGSPLTKASLDTLFHELGSVFGWKVPAGISETAIAAKVFVAGGRQDQITASEWTSIFEAGGALTGILGAFTAVSSAQIENIEAMSELFYGLSLKLRPLMLQILLKHGGRVPLEVLDQLIDVAPQEYLTIDRKKMKTALRPITRKILKSMDGESLGSESVERVMKFFSDWREGELALSAVFEKYGFDSKGFASEDFARAASQLAGERNNSQRKSLVRMAGLAIRYRPIFREGDTQAYFDSHLLNTRNNLSHFNLYDVIARYLVESYAKKSKDQRVSQQDLQEGLNDYVDIARELKLMSKPASNWALRRVIEGDLMTSLANGDLMIDPQEFADQLAMIFSLIELSHRMRKVLQDQGCEMKVQEETGDHYLRVDCFRRVIREQMPQFLDHFPDFYTDYLMYTPEQRDQFFDWLEKGSRFYGKTELPVDGSDLLTYAGMLHYIESTFQKADRNHNQSIDLKEAQALFPVFKQTIADIPGLDPDKSTTLLEIIFTFMLKKGYPPSGDPGVVAEFAAWTVSKPFWSLDTRRLTIFQIIPYIAPPFPIPADLPIPVDPK